MSFYSMTATPTRRILRAVINQGRRGGEQNRVGRCELMGVGDRSQAQAQSG